MNAHSSTIHNIKIKERTRGLKHGRGDCGGGGRLVVWGDYNAVY